MIYGTAWNGAREQPNPLFVLDRLLFFYDSWDNALEHPDGRAVIAAYLPPGWEPPEGVARVRELSPEEQKRRARAAARAVRPGDGPMRML